nr:helix-turn-helix transcriptional regulator [Streptococcus lutetiensis]
MNRLKEIRKRSGASQKDLAHLLNVSEKTISRWENNETQIKPDKARHLAKYFDVSAGYLLGFSDDRKDPLQTSLELSRKDETNEYVDLQDMVTLMDIALLKSVDTRDKILSNLKEYYDYYGERLKENDDVDENKFNDFLKNFQKEADDYIIMLLTGIVQLRDDIRITLLDILALDGEKLETVKNVVKFISNNDKGK